MVNLKSGKWPNLVFLLIFFCVTVFVFILLWPSNDNPWKTENMTKFWFSLMALKANGVKLYASENLWAQKCKIPYHVSGQAPNKEHLNQFSKFQHNSFYICILYEPVKYFFCFCSKCVEQKNTLQAWII